MRSAPVQLDHSLLACGLTACAVVAGPPLFGAAQTSPAATLAAAAIALTVLVIGVALRQRKPPVRMGAPARRQIRQIRPLDRTVGWSPP